MNESLSVEELERRWENALHGTDKAVAEHVHVYREIKQLAADIVTRRLDISDYPATEERLTSLLKTIGHQAPGSIFHFYCDRVSPSSICNLKFLRLECRHLLSHLEVFDEWRNKRCRLRVVK